MLHGGLDHLGIPIPADIYDKVVKNYLSMLAPMGVTTMFEFGGDKFPVGDPVVKGLGVAAKHDPFLWLRCQGPEAPRPTGIHFAIRTETRKEVDAFHKAAMEAGLKCNGPPGLRPHYHKDYYGAFVIDDMGNNLEAVCHCSEGGEEGNKDGAQVVEGLTGPRS